MVHFKGVQVLAECLVIWFMLAATALVHLLLSTQAYSLE